MQTKPDKSDSAIARLVDHHGGATKTAALIADGFHYQQVQQWVDRGWASPIHFLTLQKLMPKGMTTRDIESALVDLYGVTISHALITQVTDAVLDEARA